MYLNVKIGECDGVTALLYSVKVVEQVTHSLHTGRGGEREANFLLLYLAVSGRDYCAFEPGMDVISFHTGHVCSAYSLLKTLNGVQYVF